MGEEMKPSLWYFATPDGEMKEIGEVKIVKGFPLTTEIVTEHFSNEPIKMEWSIDCEATKAQTPAFFETLRLAFKYEWVVNTKRLPRKKKKALKKDIMRATGFKKIKLTYKMQDDESND